jgi:hypothetical protein
VFNSGVGLAAVASKPPIPGTSCAEGPVGKRERRNLRFIGKV